MDLTTIVLIALAVIVLVFGGGILAYFVFAVPAMRAAPPLAEEDREVCRALIRRHRAYPLLCRQSVGKGACPCQPCQKLDDARTGKQ